MFSFFKKGHSGGAHCAAEMSGSAWLRKTIAGAKEKGIAIGHFNISTMDGVAAVYRAAKKMNLPVIIGVSEGERDFFGVKEIVAVVKTIRESNNYPIFLNADHTYSFERAKEAIDAGFDSVIIDGAKLGLAENIALTKRVVEYARQTRPEVIIEAELGYIGQSSQVIDKLPEGFSLENLTTPEQAKHFVAETGVDFFAPSVGNVHGIVVGGDPALEIGRIKDIAEAIPNTPLVLHGGSGNTLAEFQNAIRAGIRIVHINTEIRVAYRKGLEKGLAEHPHEAAPYKYFADAGKEMERVVGEKLQIFSQKI